MYWSHSAWVRFRPASRQAASTQWSGSRSQTTMPCSVSAAACSPSPRKTAPACFAGDSRGGARSRRPGRSRRRAACAWRRRRSAAFRRGRAPSVAARLRRARARCVTALIPGKGTPTGSSDVGVELVDASVDGAGNDDPAADGDVREAGCRREHGAGVGVAPLHLEDGVVDRLRSPCRSRPGRGQRRLQNCPRPSIVGGTSCPSSRSTPCIRWPSTSSSNSPTRTRSSVSGDGGETVIELDAGSDPSPPLVSYQPTVPSSGKYVTARRGSSVGSSPWCRAADR